MVELSLINKLGIILKYLYDELVLKRIGIKSDVTFKKF